MYDVSRRDGSVGSPLNLHTAILRGGGATLPAGPPTFRDKSPLASEIKGTHIIVMYLPRSLCARLTVLVSKWNVVWNVISSPKRKIKIPLLGPLVSMGYYAVCARCIIYYLYTYRTRVDTSSPGVLQSIKCNLCGIDNFFYFSHFLCLPLSLRVSVSLILFVTYPTTFIFNRESHKPFFFVSDALPR